MFRAKLKFVFFLIPIKLNQHDYFQLKSVKLQELSESNIIL